MEKPEGADAPGKPRFIIPAKGILPTATQPRKVSCPNSRCMEKFEFPLQRNQYFGHVSLDGWPCLSEELKKGLPQGSSKPPPKDGGDGKGGNPGSGNSGTQGSSSKSEYGAGFPGASKAFGSFGTGAAQGGASDAADTTNSENKKTGPTGSDSTAGPKDKRADSAAPGSKNRSESRRGTKDKEKDKDSELAGSRDNEKDKNGPAESAGRSTTKKREEGGSDAVKGPLGHLKKSEVRDGSPVSGRNGSPAGGNRKKLTPGEDKANRTPLGKVDGNAPKAGTSSQAGKTQGGTKTTTKAMTKATTKTAASDKKHGTEAGAAKKTTAH